MKFLIRYGIVGENGGGSGLGEWEEVEERSIEHAELEAWAKGCQALEDVGLLDGSCDSKGEAMFSGWEAKLAEE